MSEKKIIKTPLSDETMRGLRAGEMVYISGTVYTARDAAHKRLVEMIEKGEPMPFDFAGQVVYYAGPCPNKPGFVIGSVGPTTSGRMDAYTPALIDRGLKAMIGKGLRDETVIKGIVDKGGVYFAAIGGAAALMSQCVKEVEIIAFEDLGTEAIRKLTVEELPVVVAIDSLGNNVYQHN
ncbi:fumarate hydratase [Deltaproteobacteria bacterium Smac51]|nr:fumarate hydratase [Deltaproteobacteria bacterium Smac51]